MILSLNQKVRNKWDLPISKSLLTIYKGAIVPIMAYGSEIWAHRLQVARFKRKVISIRGLAAKLTAGCYSAVFHEAAGMVAGLLPLDLEIHRRNCRKT